MTSSRVPKTRPARPMAGCFGRSVSTCSINSRMTRAAADGLSAPTYSAISSRSRSARFVQRSRKLLVPFGFQPCMVDEASLVGFTHALLDGGDLPFVQLDVLLYRFCS